MALTGIPPASFMREGNPEDPRAIRTRRLIISTYERQLTQGNEVGSVASLVRAAGVSRSSFYCHFKGVEEVGVAALRELLDHFGSGRENREGEEETLRANASGSRSVISGAASVQDLFEYMDEYRVLCAAVLVTEPDKPAYAELQATLIEHITLALGKAKSDQFDVDRRHAATFIVGGVMALVVSWLNHGDETPAQLAGVVRAMLPEWMRDTEGFETPIRISP
ncbi:TetR/AcrR family transcriptional regulator [Rhodococcus erythropolis]|uniref:TetR/AcrR family transcriptional regulator n=1 Tax=Rhodococcus erythropolis TaxID=1833 RepID=UPI00294922CA|nr:TetR/AcrR family transcriptional regulator [Rhodococcus erythropolis]MDV6212776.1 TetR/AcrR family transcriptional regulator [Rhodococcus erythropolis]